MNQKKKSEFENYPFCLFRIPRDGGRVLWEITNQCNYPCKYCIFNCKFMKDNNELITSEVENALKELRQKKFKYIKFTGGEPFMRKDLMGILRLTKKLGFHIDISTNASLINMKKAKELVKLVEMVHVSIDGHNKEVHEMARGKGTFEPTILGLRNLVQAGNYVRVGTVIFKGNENYLEEIVKLMISNSVNEIIFSFMESIGRLDGNTKMISKRGIEETKAEIISLSNKYPQIKINYSFTESLQCKNGKCPAVEKFLYIDNLGRLSPCTWVTGKFPKYKTAQTLKEVNLSKLIDSMEIKSYLAYLQKLGCGGCPVRLR